MKEKIMEHIVWMTSTHKIVLTTNSLGSSYGIPAMRMYGEIPYGEQGIEIEPDLGPSDRFPNGTTAAELCCQTYHFQDEDTQAASRAFCHQWPDGPQPGGEHE